MTHLARRNRYLNTLEMRQRRLTLQSRPYSIQLEVTTKCNLACIMCARDKYHGRGSHLPDDVLQPVLRELFPYCQDIIVSSFGEPLLYPRFPELLEHIQPESGLEMGFFTNLLVLTEEMAEAIVQRGVGYVNVSIDGATPETYERIRAGGDWDVLEEKLRLFNRVKARHGTDKPVMNLCVVGSTLNIGETALFVDFAHKHGFASVKYNPNMYVDDEDMEYMSLVHEQPRAVRMFEVGYRRALELDMHTNFHQKPFAVAAERDAPVIAPRAESVPTTQLVANMLKRVWRTNLGWRWENTWRQSGGDRRQFFFLGLNKARDYAIDHIPGWRLVRRKPPIPHVIPNDAPPKTCGNPWTHVHVKSDGLVYPCCFSDEVMGDLRSQSFEEIWNGEKYQDLRRSLSKGKPWASCRRASCNWVQGLESSRYGCRIELLDALEMLDGTTGAGVRVRVTNTGLFNWLPMIHKKKPVQEFVALSYRLFSPESELIDEGDHIPIEAPVKPGESVEMTLRVRPVRFSGLARVKIDLVHEGVTWFGERGNNALEVPVTIANVPFAAWVEVGDKSGVTRALDRYLAPGERVELPLIVRNVGTAPLGDLPERDSLSTHWRDESGTCIEWEGPRLDLSPALAPGESRRVLLPVEVPRTAATGRYQVEVDLVREDEEWLSLAWARPLLAWPVRVAASAEETSRITNRDARGKVLAFEPRGQCVTNTGNKGIW